jgi:hypothetical protein
LALVGLRYLSTEECAGIVGGIEQEQVDVPAPALTDQRKSGDQSAVILVRADLPGLQEDTAFAGLALDGERKSA